MSHNLRRSICGFCIVIVCDHAVSAIDQSGTGMRIAYCARRCSVRAVHWCRALPLLHATRCWQPTRPLRTQGSQMPTQEIQAHGINPKPIQTRSSKGLKLFKCHSDLAALFYFSRKIASQLPHHPIPFVTVQRPVVVCIEFVEPLQQLSKHAVSLTGCRFNFLFR